MSTATVFQIGQDLRAWIAAVQQGDTVAIVDGGREVARLVPPVKKKAAATPPAWSWQNHLAELEAIFPEPVNGASEELKLSREERC